MHVCTYVCLWLFFATWIRFCISITISMHKYMYMYEILVWALRMCCVYVCFVVLCTWMYIMTTRSLQVDIICVCLRSRMYEHWTWWSDSWSCHLTYIITSLLTYSQTHNLSCTYMYDDPYYLIWYHLACCIHHHLLLLL